MPKNISPNSVEAYKKEYHDGWYPRYPDSDVIKIYERFFKNKFLQIDRPVKILDFGCANGTIPIYFKSKGYDVYGIDVIPDAIEECKRRLPDNKENFKLINHGQDVENLFDTKFDIIFSREALHYLSNHDLNKTLKQFDTMLNDSGFVYFTMMGKENHYYKFVKNEIYDGLCEVTLSGRLDETTYINFIDGKEDLIQKFSIFEPIFTGYYDITLQEGSSYHYLFTGKKRSIR